MPNLGDIPSALSLYAATSTCQWFRGTHASQM